MKDSLKDKNLNIIECPSCNKNLKTKDNSVGTIICPTCHFKFAADTSFNLGKVDYQFLKNSSSKTKELVSIKDEKKKYLFNNQYQRLKLFLIINRYY